MAEEQKILKNSIVVDTLTAIQDAQYMAEVKKPNFDKWRDYGRDIYNFITHLQKLGFEIIMILGEPGTGKSTGMRTLDPEKNIWFNADNKNPMWTGGKKQYGSKLNPIDRKHFIPTTYEEILDRLAGAIDHGAFEEGRYAFILGHVEDYKSGYDVRRRISVLGSLANKMRLEGRMETVLYAKVVVTDEGNEYVFETQNDGLNTARSPMNVFEDIIPNDFQLILDKLKDF